MRQSETAKILEEGLTTLGIELGSTNIKATIVGSNHQVLANGSFKWENQFQDRLWTYPLNEVWTGIQEAVTKVRAAAQKSHGVNPHKFAAIGISAMMHGYLAFDTNNQLLVPFRTWRNTNTGAAATELSGELDYNIPLRWSLAHFYQAVLDKEEHVDQVRFLTTLAGYVHWQLTDQKIIGIGDASGMFPIDPTTRTYDTARLNIADQVFANHGVKIGLADLLPTVMVAGQPAGRLTSKGAKMLDASGTILPGIPLCPPEGDAGTGMVATNSVTPRTGNVSAGTSIFAMVVLEHPLSAAHAELDLVTTPAGDLVAMVHCNNGASELAAWADLFSQFLRAMDAEAETGKIYEALLEASLAADDDAGGMLAYNYLSGEPLTGLEEGRPLVVRTPDATFDLANFMRAQIYSMFATLSLGMRVLKDEGVEVENMFAHGGIFKTPGVAQRFLAAAVGAPVSVGLTASEGGSWGIAVLAQYLIDGQGKSLSEYLQEKVFADAKMLVEAPLPADIEGYGKFLKQYTAGLKIQATAVAALR